MNTTLAPDHLDYYLESAQREIAFCQYCQPTEAGRRVWRNGLPLKISDLLYRLGVPELDQEYVAESLECNNCGMLLNLAATIGVKSQSEREWEQLWQKWEAQFAPRFRDFHDFLADYPSLGLQHRMGRQFFKALGDLPRHEIVTAQFYAARPVTTGAPVKSEDFMSPSSNANFYYHAGQQVYLLTDSEAGAGREILGRGEKIVWLQKFHLARSKGILDLSRVLTEGSSPLAAPLIYGLCYPGENNTRENHAKLNHALGLVPRFLTDCARMHGFHGVRTKSLKHPANNLILFAWPADTLAPEGEPYLFDTRAAK